ncbi:MAG TPA: hypothetical protein VFP00_07920 [Burkholderiales bacterium]|nr:hypothetical protein [Burkholderiales bacterium]
MATAFSTSVVPTGRLWGSRGSRRAEPYVVLTSIDLRPPRAEVEVLLYGAWQSTDANDSADVASLIWREGIWELDLSAPPMEHPNDVVLLLALIEHFDGEPCVFKSLIRNALMEAADASLYSEHKTRVACFIDALDRSMDRANGGPNLTSAIEMSLSVDDIMLLEASDSCRLMRSFCGYGGQYCLEIELKTASEAWTLLPQRHEACAWAAA